MYMGGKLTKVNAILLYLQQTTFHTSEMNWIRQNLDSVNKPLYPKLILTINISNYLVSEEY